MRRLLTAAAAAGLLATACSQAPLAVAQDPPETESRGISVSGTGEVTGRPDTLSIDLGVSVLRESASQAIADAAALADQLIATLRDSGVDDQDIQTATYSVAPEYDYSDERPKVIGYRVQNVLTVKIRDLGQAGQTIDAATASAGEDVVVQGIRFDLEENQALLEAARRAAWEDARSKAEQLADLAGVTLGNPTSISESFASPPPPVFYDDHALAEASTPIEPGQQAVTVTISVTFDLGS